MIQVSTHSPDQTRQVAQIVTGVLRPTDVVALIGPLGAGKTVFVQGMAEALSIGKREVSSPTFVILKEYDGKYPLYHFDVYRLGSAGALETVGYRDYFYGDGITVIEWADKIRELLPPSYIEVRCALAKEDERVLSIRGYRIEPKRISAIERGLRKSGML